VGESPPAPVEAPSLPSPTSGDSVP
jgi:hypothetical protein